MAFQKQTAGVRPGPSDPARMIARPEPPVGNGPTGLQRLGLDQRRDGSLFVPPSYRPETPAPLVLMLHGAGGDAQNGLLPFIELAERDGVVLLGVDSRGATWDVIGGGYGDDVAFINRALEQTFGRYRVDPSRVAIEGFSDGASYALSLGLTNGDLFSAVIAFSPGFMAPSAPRGAPRVFVSHGTGDRVLPIDRCSRQLVPELVRAGYDVRYEEFDGPHTVPPAIAVAGLSWFLKGRATDLTPGSRPGDRL